MKCFGFLGWNVKFQSDKTLLDQNHYINNISKLLISPRRSDSLISNENEKKNASRKKLVNCYGLHQTRLDYIKFEKCNSFRS